MLYSCITRGRCYVVHDVCNMLNCTCCVLQPTCYMLPCRHASWYMPCDTLCCIMVCCAVRRCALSYCHGALRYVMSHLSAAQPAEVLSEEKMMLEAKSAVNSSDGKVRFAPREASGKHLRSRPHDPPPLGAEPGE